MEDEQRAAAGLEIEEAVGDLEQRRPYLEGRVHLERIGPIVLKDGQQRTGVDQEGGIAAGFECPGGPQADPVEVRGEQGIESSGARQDGSVHGVAKGANGGHLGAPAEKGIDCKPLVRAGLPEALVRRHGADLSFQGDSKLPRLFPIAW